MKSIITSLRWYQLWFNAPQGPKIVYIHKTLKNHGTLEKTMEVQKVLLVLFLTGQHIILQAYNNLLP